MAGGGPTAATPVTTVGPLRVRAPWAAAGQCIAHLRAAPTVAAVVARRTAAEAAVAPTAVAAVHAVAVAVVVAEAAAAVAVRAVAADIRVARTKSSPQRSNAFQ